MSLFERKIAGKAVETVDIKTSSYFPLAMDKLDLVFLLSAALDIEKLQ